jgi:serine/threonine protein kinase
MILICLFPQMSGLEALHEMKIIHCDLKPENILVAPDGHLIISDFGLSTSWLDSRYNRYPSHAFRGRRLAGTDGYMAPEIASALLNPDMPRRGNFGFAADIWSMGVIIAELGMGGRRFLGFEDEEEKQAWKGDFKHFAQRAVLSRDPVVKRIEGNLHGDHALLVERVRDFSTRRSGVAMLTVALQKMLDLREATRAGFDEISSHPFFSGLDIESVTARQYPGKAPLEMAGGLFLTKCTYSSSPSVGKRSALSAHRSRRSLVLKVWPHGATRGGFVWRRFGTPRRA